MAAYTSQPVAISKGVGTGPAGPATAGPMFPEPTIKNIIPLFVIEQIILQLHVYTILIQEMHYYIIERTRYQSSFKQRFRYKLGACKKNSRSLRVKLNNRFPRRFLLMSCHQVPRVHLKNLLKFKFFKFLK